MAGNATSESGVHLRIHRQWLNGGALRIEGRLQGPPGHSHTLFFEVPRAQAGWVTPLADPVLVALLMPLMKWGFPVHVHGAVTARLLANLVEYQRIFARWLPDELREIPITADRIARPRRASRYPRPLLAFSGGTDSLFSAHKWSAPVQGPSRLAWAVLAQGFDIPLEGEDYFRRHADQCRSVLASRNVSLFTARTNAMETAGAFGLRWGLTHHGPAVASLLLLFQRKFDLGLIASTYVCDNVSTPWGSNSLTDPLLGSGEMGVLHDGAAFDRMGKLRRLRDWPEAFAGMRVCWKWPRPSGNCGACYKCLYVRTILKVLGVEESMPFDVPLDESSVRALDLENQWNLMNWERLLAEAEKTLRDSPWLETIRITVERGRAAYAAGSPPIGGRKPR